MGQDGPVALDRASSSNQRPISALEQGPRFVSRGGIKLDNAIEALKFDVAGLDCLDTGASTGGFTDCLLQRGAARVAALDVAYGQIDQRMREDPRVTVIERLNARVLSPADLPFRPDLATVDVSFISLTKVLPAIAACLAAGGEVLAMVKPQFELGRDVSAGASSATRPTARGDPLGGRCRRASWGCRCAGWPPPACPALRASARPSSGAAATGSPSPISRAPSARSIREQPGCRPDHPRAPAGDHRRGDACDLRCWGRRLAADRDRRGARQARRCRRPDRIR